MKIAEVTQACCFCFSKPKRAVDTICSLISHSNAIDQQNTTSRFVPSMTQHSNLKHLQFFGQAQFVNFTELRVAHDITFRLPSVALTVSRIQIGTLSRGAEGVAVGLSVKRPGFQPFCMVAIQFTSPSGWASLRPYAWHWKRHGPMSGTGNHLPLNLTLETACHSIPQGTVLLESKAESAFTNTPIPFSVTADKFLTIFLHATDHSIVDCSYSFVRRGFGVFQMPFYHVLFQEQNDEQDFCGNSMHGGSRCWTSE